MYLCTKNQNFNKKITLKSGNRLKSVVTPISHAVSDISATRRRAAKLFRFAWVASCDSAARRRAAPHRTSRLTGAESRTRIASQLATKFLACGRITSRRVAPRHYDLFTLTKLIRICIAISA